MKPFAPAALAPSSRGAIEIHGVASQCRYDVRDRRPALSHMYSWHWDKRAWTNVDIVVAKKTGKVSFDLRLAEDSEHFELVKGGWKKDHCFICRWELFESQNDADHGTGYTNGHDWMCAECYAKFWEHPDFFSSPLIPTSRNNSACCTASRPSFINGHAANLRTGCSFFVTSARNCLRCCRSAATFQPSNGPALISEMQRARLLWVEFRETLRGNASLLLFDAQTRPHRKEIYVYSEENSSTCR
jgi:hypothetical protein